MSLTKGYRTRQRRLILNYIAKNNNRHITAEDIMDHIKQEGDSVGKSTVYRYLNILLEKGIIYKYFVGKGNTACYRYVKELPNETVVYHLKCLHCGQIKDISCEALDLAINVLWEKEHFKLDTKQTLLYGECQTCLRHVNGILEKEEIIHD